MSREARDAPQFYLTAPSACPYLPGQQERKIFTHLVGKRAAGLNDLLTQTGFRRSQTIAYRPACESCRACVSVRVLVDDFRPSDSQRRTIADERRPCRRLYRAETDQRALRPLPLLSRRPASRGRHGRHVVARFRHDGRGHPYRHRADRISRAERNRRPARLGSLCSRSASPTAWPTACRWSIPSMIPTSRAGRSGASSFSTISRRRAASACPMSISAIGSRGRKRWAIRRPTCPRSASACTAGRGWRGSNASDPKLCETPAFKPCC